MAQKRWAFAAIATLLRERAEASIAVNDVAQIALARDPWGSPYLRNENEGENLDVPCQPDAIASAGPNGLFGAAADIVVAVPNAFYPETR